MKSLFLLLSVCFTVSLAAQHQTLLGRSPLNGAFGAPIYEYGIRDGVQGGVGGGGGLVFRHFFLGAYGMASIDDLDDLLELDNVDNLRLAHGGLWLGLTPASYSVIHPIINVKGGWGVLDIEFNDPGQDFGDLDQVFVITPDLGLEVNITRWFRLSGTVGYRYLTGINDSTPAGVSDSLEGLMGGVTLRFGWFGSNNQWERMKWDRR